MLGLHVLASGSKGNAAIVQDTASGDAVLIDCGICKRDFVARCEQAGVSLADIRAIVVTHDHSDHTKCLGVVARGLARAQLAPPVYALGPVRESCAAFAEIAATLETHAMAVGDELLLGSLSVLPFKTSHDAAASCGFRIECAGDALGYVTDTGVVSEAMLGGLSGVRLLAIETNHDASMLREGPYPWALKQRIASEAGHLSNEQASRAVAALAHDGLEHVMGMHLSQENNLPRLARSALEGALAAAGCDAQVFIASQVRLVSMV